MISRNFLAFVRLESLKVTSWSMTSFEIGLKFICMGMIYGLIRVVSLVGFATNSMKFSIVTFDIT